MRLLHAISTFLFILGGGFFVFDLFCHLMNLVLDLCGINMPPLVEGMMKKISIESWWTAANKDSYEIAKSLTAGAIPSSTWNMLVHLPAPTILIFIGVIFYIPWKLLSLVGVGKRA